MQLFFIHSFVDFPNLNNICIYRYILLNPRAFLIANPNNDKTRVEFINRKEEEEENNSFCTILIFTRVKGG